VTGPSATAAGDELGQVVRAHQAALGRVSDLTAQVAASGDPRAYADLKAAEDEARLLALRMPALKAAAQAAQAAQEQAAAEALADEISAWRPTADAEFFRLVDQAKNALLAVVACGASYNAELYSFHEQAGQVQQMLGGLQSDGRVLRVRQRRLEYATTPQWLCRITAEALRAVPDRAGLVAADAIDRDHLDVVVPERPRT
jgi:hypothetical protein